VKGREWAHVVVHHVSEGLLPHRLAPDLEEERRVFHVALTRCRRTVAIVPGEPPSPFLLELEAPGEPAADPRVLRAARGAPPRTALGAGTRSTAVTRRPSPAGVGQRGADETARDAPDAPALPASPGMTFTRRGHRYEVLEVRADGVLARIGEGPATTAVAFGTPVTADGRVVILAHPLVEVAFAQLRSWRSARAKVLNKPAFVVCGDRTLSLIAAMLPTNEAALLRVGGIGPVKLETYGDELLAIAERLRSRDATSPGAGAPPR